jgi:hypothetical protein
MSMSFIERCLSGDAFLDEIDEHVDVWHDDNTSENIELYEYLGMTWQEYSLWVTNPNILGLIIDTRRKGQTLENAPIQEITALAARAFSKEEAQRVMSWLQRIGKLDET